jgi:phage terminase large subunit GpA-like protein
MNATGRYVAPGQTVTDADVVVGDPPDSDTCSFWVSGLCSPFRSFGDRAAAYVEATQSGDPAKVQTVVNAGFGELWAPSSGDVPEWREVEGCSLPYAKGTVPAEVAFLTSGVDVQKRKLVFVVRGWGVRQESWLIDHGEIWGDTRLDQVWADLWEQVIDRSLRRSPDPEDVRRFRLPTRQAGAGRHPQGLRFLPSSSATVLRHEGLGSCAPADPGRADRGHSSRQATEVRSPAGPSRF